MLTKMLKKAIRKAKIPGLSMATLSQDGEIVNQAVGVTDMSVPSPVTETTIFEAASLSKPVFAYIILKMIERGELSLDQPLYEISTEFGPPHLRDHPYFKMLTVRNILSHQAGLPNWFRAGSPEEFLAEPNERFDYSGLAFCFLNEALTSTPKKSLEQLAQELFSDLGMSSSSFLPPEEGTLRAIGHDADGNPDEREHFPRKFGPNPAASLFTTADDYAKFLRACINDPFTRENMFEPQVELVSKDKKALEIGVSPKALEHLAWGLGVGLQTAPDNTMIAFHWGDGETNRSFAAINLQTKEAVVCFTNSENGPLVFQQLVEPVVGDLRAVWHWLSRREGLPLQEKKQSELLSGVGLFSNKLEDDFLEEHRHDDPKLQQESKGSDLVLKK